MRASRISLVALVALLTVAMPVSGLLTGASPAAVTTVAAVSSDAAASTPAPPVHPAIPSEELAQLENRASHVDRKAGLDSALGMEPNLDYATVREGSAIVPVNLADGQVSPGPTSIGVNDLGLRVNSLGEFVPYSYRTTSLDGTVTIDNISLLPVMTNASDAITVQENAILNNVTLFGQSIYQIWAQNVIFYSPAGDQLQLLTDAWNFTGPPFEVFPNDIYANSPGGFIFTGTYVHQVPLAPPAFVVRPPFTIRLYLNATNLGGRNALFFNYTLSSAYDIRLGHQNLGRSINHGSFDWIIFNSTAGMPAGYAGPPASFLISGSQESGIGLANDAEIAICGPSDGFSAVIRSLTASAQLLYLNGTTGTFSAVPAAFTTTEDTGESVEGVDAHFTVASAARGLAYLTSGPEFIYGLWNATAPGVPERQYRVDVSPASALVWVSPDQGGARAGFTNVSAAWALSPGPQLTFWLPTGPGETYSAAILANDYAPAYAPLPSTALDRFDLRPDPSVGLYVPVIAFGNAAVARIAQSGEGTAFDPYIISYAQTQPISSLFGTFDEFSEPLYPGFLVSGVTAHVDIVRPPSFTIQYTNAELFFLEYFWGLSPPHANDLPIEVYDSSNVSIVGAAHISGWFPVSLTGFLLSSLFLSNDTHTLVAYDRFSSMGSAMVIVDPNGNGTKEYNTVFGNRFTVDPIVYGPHGSSLYVVLAFNTSYTGPPAVGGLGVFSSGNTIYGNLFRTPITAYSPPQNPFLAYVFVNDLGYHDFSAVASTWTNRWNISLEPAWAVQFVNGIPLTGSIVGAPFQGGNAWSNWNGSIPYPDQGLIVDGGDYLPLPLPGSGHYAVVFAEWGLPRGTAWQVTLGGTTYSSDGPLILAYATPGAYRFVITSSDGRVAFPSSGTIHVHGNELVTVLF